MYQFDGLGLKLFTESQLEAIHVATARVLEEAGVKVYGDEALDIYDGAGCHVDKKNNMVRIPQNVLEDAIRSAPSKVFMAARDPKYDVVMEAGKTYFTTFGTGVEVVDPKTGHLHESTLKDLEDIIRVCDAVDEVARCGVTIAARDKPEETRELYQVEACLKNTTKHVGGSTNFGITVKKFVEMGVAISGSLEKLRERPIISCGTCPHSPLTLHTNNTEVIIEGARAGIPTGVLTMAMAGGTAPVTLAGALVVTAAEVLSGIVLVQLVRKGNPVIFGSSTTMLDLLYTTAPAGSPELALVGAGVAQLGQYYKIPTNVGGNWADSKLPDAQIGHEKTLTAMLPALAGANNVYGMGVQDSGMSFSYGQLLMDAEFVRMYRSTLRGIAVNDETLAVDVIKKVGAGKNYLSQAHTLKFMQREQSRAKLIDRRMRDAWLRKGGKDLYHRANEEAIGILETHKPTPLDPAVEKKLRDIILEVENS